MAARTDIHRPATPGFDPAAYEWTGHVIDFTPDNDGTNADINDHINTLARNGYQLTRTGRGCDHCGQNLRYAALLRHDDTRTLIYVGKSCLDNRFLLLSKTAFARKQAAAATARKEAKTLKAFTEFCETNQAMAYASYVNNITASGDYFEGDTDTLRDLYHRARRTGTASAAQVGLAGKILDRLAPNAAAFAARQAERDEARAAAKPVPTGRVTVSGTVLSTKVTESVFGFSHKMLVEDVSGFRVFGSVPRALSDVKELKGCRVDFVATLSPSNDDEKFGFFSRPSAAKFA